MKTPKLSFEAIAAALAVLGATTTVVGCNKAPEKAAPAPESTGSAQPLGSTTPAAATPPPTAAADPGMSAAAAAPAAVPTAAVAATDAGAPSGAVRNKKAGGSASCGAGSCSADMKKGK